jgi:hypothetical protein
MSQALAAQVPVVSYSVGGVGEYLLRAQTPPSPEVDSGEDSSSSSSGMCVEDSSSSSSSLPSSCSYRHHHIDVTVSSSDEEEEVQSGGGATAGVVAWEPTPLALAAGVLKLLDRSSLRNEIGRTARKTVRKTVWGRGGGRGELGGGKTVDLLHLFLKL